MDVRAQNQLHDNIDSWRTCPICHGKLCEEIYLCESGHNACDLCAFNVGICVCCGRPFTGVRNYLAEVLSRQIDKMEDVVKETARMVVTAEQIVQRQQDTRNERRTVRPKRRMTPPIATQFNTHQYPCCVNESCKFVGDHQKLLQHFKAAHSSQFQENLGVKQAWLLPYHPNTGTCIINRVFQIPMGTFMLHIFINDSGAVKATLLMYHTAEDASKYLFDIDVRCYGFHASFCGVVECIEKYKNLLEDNKNLYTYVNDSLYKAIQQRKQFLCSVVIKNKSQVCNNDHQAAGPCSQLDEVIPIPNTTQATSDMNNNNDNNRNLDIKTKLMNGMSRAQRKRYNQKRNKAARQQNEVIQTKANDYSPRAKKIKLSDSFISLEVEEGHRHPEDNDRMPSVVVKQEVIDPYWPEDSHVSSVALASVKTEIKIEPIDY